MNTALNTQQEKIFRLLGQGISQRQVADAIGVDESYISQLMAIDENAEKVRALKLAALSDRNNRDSRLDGLEDALIDRLEQDVKNNPVAFRNAMERVRALQMVNGMKRRGIMINDADDLNNGNQKTLTLTLPASIINKISKMSVNIDIETDINNQIIKAGNQDLITLQSKNIDSLLPNSGDNSNEQSMLVSSKKSRPVGIEKFA